MEEIYRLEAGELQKLLDIKQISSEEATRAFLERIDRFNPKLNALISVFHEDSMRMARESDSRRSGGKLLSPWDGIPIVIKDNIALEGKVLSCASNILSNFKAPYNAFVTEKILSHGLVPIGKSNMDEFAMGSSNENSAFGPVLNPWDSSRVPGGSSGGSAVSVAAGFAPWALGSDTGGSIRLPASFCGVHGMKPTYGKVSRYGLVAYGSSLDQIGPFARTVGDIARLTNIISGKDALDSTSIESKEIDLNKIPEDVKDSDLKGWKIGLPQEYFSDQIDPEVLDANKKCSKILEEAGAQLIDITLPHTEYAVPVYYLIATAEASSNLARYDGVRYGIRNRDAHNISDVYAKSRHSGLGKEVKRRILLGTYVLSSGYYDAYYRKASKVRTLISGDFTKVFEEVDIIIAPVGPTPAFPLGDKLTDPIEMYLSDILTISANLAGIPAISINGGFTKGGLPIGVQVLGAYFQEEKILRAARFIEEAVEKRNPELSP